MKKILLTAAVAAFAISSASAQFKIGPRVGMNFSTLRATKGEGSASDNFNDATKSKAGFHAGLSARIGLPGPLFVQPEVLYTQVGNKFDLVNAERKLTANYLQVPVLVGLGFKVSKVGVHGNVGPYGSFWMSGSEEAGGEKTDIKFEKDAITGTEYNRLDVGLMAGVGVSIDAGPGAFHVDLRASQGFSDINKYSGDRPDLIPKYSNRVYSLSVAYLFAFGL